MTPKCHLKIDGKKPSLWFPNVWKQQFQLLFCGEKGGTQYPGGLITADYFL